MASSNLWALWSLLLLLVPAHRALAGQQRAIGALVAMELVAVAAIVGAAILNFIPPPTPESQATTNWVTFVLLSLVVGFGCLAIVIGWYMGRLLAETPSTALERPVGVAPQRAITASGGRPRIELVRDAA